MSGVVVTDYDMLSEFRGIIDSEGLRSFRQCSESAHLRPFAESPSVPCIPFWAVVETTTATGILRELMLGSRKRALRMLEESALDLGSC